MELSGKWGELIVHSDYRPSKGKNSIKEKEEGTRVVNSYHKIGVAIDFRLDSYVDLSKKERMYVYYQKNQLLESFLQKHDLFEKVGLGVYPFAIKPFWHLDLRGSMARWCRNEKKQYVGILAAKKGWKKGLLFSNPLLAF